MTEIITEPEPSEIPHVIKLSQLAFKFFEFLLVYMTSQERHRILSNIIVPKSSENTSNYSQNLIDYFYK